MSKKLNLQHFNGTTTLIATDNKNIDSCEMGGVTYPFISGGSAGEDVQVRGISISDYSAGYITHDMQYFIDNPSQTLASTQYVLRQVSDFAGNCWSVSLMQGSLQYLPHDILATGQYNGRNATALIIHVNGSQPSPYSALFMVGATNLNQGLNLSGVFIDSTGGVEGTQYQIPLLYNGGEIGTVEYTNSTCATVLTDANDYTDTQLTGKLNTSDAKTPVSQTNKLLTQADATGGVFPNYNAKSTLTIQPNSSLTPTSNCFVYWADASYDININNSYVLIPGMYPIFANDTINNNGDTPVSVAFYQAR